MKSIRPVRIVRLCCVALGCSFSCAMAQTPASTFPRMGPTAAGVALPSSGQGVATGQGFTGNAGAATRDAAHRARVSWSEGVLTISAENSSLNQILREVCRQTGMKVTGGVNEERVYGNYGPGVPEVVLASLLLGTGSNFLLKEDAANGPVELVLSPRQGGPTPMNPIALSGDDAGEDDLPPQRTAPSSRTPVVSGNPESGSPGAGSPGAGSSRAGIPGSSGGDAAAQGASNVGGNASTPTVDQPSPNGVKTPQQIYDELMKLQQQKTAKPTSPQQTTPK